MEYDYIDIESLPVVSCALCYSVVNYFGLNLQLTHTCFPNVDIFWQHKKKSKQSSWEKREIMLVITRCFPYTILLYVSDTYP